MTKLTSLKNQNRNIEDIYRYTNDIIFEEEGEQTDNRESDQDDSEALSESKIYTVKKRYDDEATPLNMSPSFYINSDALLIDTAKMSKSNTVSKQTSPDTLRDLNNNHQSSPYAIATRGED